MPRPISDPAADAFLKLVDLLDAEARTVNHAIAQARSVVRSVVEELDAMSPAGSMPNRAWTETGLRLMQHRGALVEALARIPNPRAGNPEISPTGAPDVRLPVPPRPRRSPRAGPVLLDPWGAENQGMPAPPRPVSAANGRRLSPPAAPGD